jgi:MOSC domain
VEGTGLEWDRKFAWAEFVKPQTRLDASEEEQKPVWTFQTLRTKGYEKLALVKPEIWIPDKSKAKKDDSSSKDKEAILIIKYPNIPSGFLAPLDRLAISFSLFPKERSFQVPLNRPPDHKYPSEDVVISKSKPRWLNYGVHVLDDFRHWLGVKNPLTLFRADPASYREVHRNAPSKESLGYQPSIGFVDAYPVHLLNLASVRDIAAKMKVDIPNFSARRFRSNILLTGLSAYNEDDWKRIRIGGDEFYCACHTVRCRLPNVDPDSSERQPVEPDKTPKSFRCIDDGDPKNACLGLMLVPVKEKDVTLKVGQGIEVLELGEHHYIRQWLIN